MEKIATTLPDATKAYMAERSREIASCLDRILPAEKLYPHTLHQSMRYSIFAGGKRLRPILFLAACDTCGGNRKHHLPSACSLEMVHTYSLIHDDLPAMDNDDVRRGRPTNHKRFGEAMAILAGDGLLTYAFETIVTHEQDPATAAAMVRELAQGAGAAGMVGGQVADMEAEDAEALATFEHLCYIHEHKTARLIAAALRMGAVAAHASKADIRTMGKFGMNLGLAFQIRDDILDELSSSEVMGKTVGKDRRAGKLTYPALLGMEKAWAQALRLIQEANALLEPYGENAAVLRDLADFVVARQS